jgi:DNA-binding transcriptional ArsR family regulator
MRALNQRLVLDRLRERGEATRPRIAADTGLSKPTVGQALLDLEQHGLVRTTGRRRLFGGVRVAKPPARGEAPVVTA